MTDGHNNRRAVLAVGRWIGGLAKIRAPLTLVEHGQRHVNRGTRMDPPTHLGSLRRSMTQQAPLS